LYIDAELSQLPITDGFKADISGEFEEGSEVWLKIAGFEAKRSRMVWRDGEMAGCEFETPLHDAELEAMIAPKPRKIPTGVFGRV
jgi:hypothetical protein